MANLIPPDAKQAIRTEYWIRVVTVWLVLIALALAVVAIFNIPTFVLVQTQLAAYNGAYGVAKEQAEQFEGARATIQDANELSAMLASGASTTPFIVLIATLDAIAGDAVEISGFELKKSDVAVTDIVITGTAETRFALAAFSQAIEADPLFAEAALPLSNLARERDIPFSINVTPATP